MHSDFARQGTRVFTVDPAHGRMLVMADCATPEFAEQITTALQRTETEGDAADAIRQALRDFEFETARYITTSENSLRTEHAHLNECPDCRHSKARIERDEEILDALHRRMDGILRAEALYPRSADDDDHTH